MYVKSKTPSKLRMRLAHLVIRRQACRLSDIFLDIIVERGHNLRRMQEYLEKEEGFVLTEHERINEVWYRSGFNRCIPRLTWILLGFQICKSERRLRPIFHICHCS